VILQILCEAVVLTLCVDNMTTVITTVANSVSGIRGMSDVVKNGCWITTLRGRSSDV